MLVVDSMELLRKRRVLHMEREQLVDNIGESFDQAVVELDSLGELVLKRECSLP